MLIYPRAIAKTKLTPKKLQCFILIPFSPDFDEAYSTMKQALAEIGFECCRADDLFDNKPIMTTVVTEIVRSHFVIADLTNRNPNVFYEVGIAHAVRDLPNVILIARDLGFVPFDLRHLPVIIYKQDNLRHLAVHLKKRILENRYIFETQVKLRERYERYASSSADFDELVLLLESGDGIYRELVARVVNLDTQAQDDPALLVTSLFRLRNELALQLRLGRFRHFELAFKVFRDALRALLHIPEIEAHVSTLLAQNAIPEFQLPEKEQHGLLIDLATSLYFEQRYRQRALEWLLNYLDRPKVGGIDLNRSKVEGFLMMNADHEIREHVVLCLFRDSVYLREAAADFIGELRIEEGAAPMAIALQKERNIYVIRSIFSAFGKLGLGSGGEAVIRWTRQFGAILTEPANEFLIGHARSALTMIDSLHGTRQIDVLESILLDLPG